MRAFRILAFARPVGVASCVASSAACAGATKPAPGEVLVVVTTDMAVPEDIDTLRWSATSGGGTTPFKTRTLALTASSLPGTLAVVSGPETTGPVLVQIDALSGGTTGVVRVHREAELTALPRAGVKRLSMALDWLCSDANPVRPCASGMTCVAGACATASVDPATLPDYVPVDGGPCFDVVKKCFAAAASLIETVPTRDATGRCVIAANRSTAILNPEYANFALVVNTSVAGNYGACEPGGACLIALDPGTPEGWIPIADDGGITGVALPGRVCDIDVAVQISGACPSKALDAPLCGAPPTCAHLEDVDCPSGWRPYSCSSIIDGGTASPSDIDPAETNCWPARGPSAEGGPTPTSALLCCSGPQIPAADPLLIDDMSGEPQLKITAPASDEVPGVWYTFSVPDANAVIFPPKGYFEYTSIAPPLSTPDGGVIDHAACFRAPYPFYGTIVAEGFDFAIDLTNAPAPFDVRNYTGIRFWAWSQYAGQSLGVNFPDKDTDTESSESTCNRLLAAGDGDAGCGDHYQKLLTVSDMPSEYVAKWSELTQQGAVGLYQAAAFDEAHVLATNFAVYNSGPMPYSVPIDVCVTQVYFTR
jgi:hypothetical protein